ncbi:MAG: hypothetical protein RI935_709 [Candidatus Parcubacteria bacterium]|jgi:hypothetical protein
MAQKKKTSHTIAEAVALHLYLETDKPTQPQCINRLLVRVRELVEKPFLTLHQLKQGIAEWLKEGWVTVSNNTIYVLRAGRVHVEKIADQASAPPQMSTA